MAEPTGVYISKLHVNRTEYTIRDAWARDEIATIEEAIKGGVHFRGISTIAIQDGDAVKDLVVLGETYPAAKQVDGDMFIYDAGTETEPKNLEFIVAGGKYSELGSTGVLGALAFKNSASGSAVVPLASSITAEAYTPQVSKGTLTVSTVSGSVGATATDATFDFTSANATLSTTTATATVATEAAAADVTTTATAASLTYTATTVTAAGPSVSLTYTTGTFTALQDVTYDANSATLSISSVTSEAFTKVPGVASVGDVTVTYDKVSSVTYDKTTHVTYSLATSVTYEKVSGVAYDKVNAVTYDKASGTFLSSASLEGDLAVTAAAPTLTITNPTVTVTVS